MPFGMMNAPKVFIGLINRVFHQHLDQFVIVFIDILAYLRNKDQRKEQLKIVLETLRNDKLYAKFKTCEYWLDRVGFLGCMLTTQGIEVDPTKVEMVTKWPKLSNVGEVHSFLGLASYYSNIH